MPPPNLYYRQAQEPPPQPRFSVLAGLFKALLILAFVGGAGWAFYHFYWTRRLTEEHVLTDQQGNVIRARLEGRTNNLLQYVSLDNNTVNLMPISALVADDQAYVRQLPPTLSLECPFDCVLTAPNGQPTPVSIVRRSEAWLKYTVLSDHSSHYVAISALPAADQQLVRQFPSPRPDRYPADYILSDAAGQAQEVRIVGRNDSFVEYVTVADNQTHFQSISALPEADQSFVRQLQNYFSILYPLETTLTDNAGHKINGVVNGRNNDVLKITVTGEERPRFYPLVNFAVEDQQILQLLPANIPVLQFPSEMMLSDQAGRAMPVRVIHRSDALVQFVTIKDNLTHLYPLSLLSTLDQTVLQYFQPVTVFHYPLDSSLADDKGVMLKVRFEGRTGDSVIYTTLLDNIKHIAPLIQLSALDRNVLQMIPTNAPDAAESQSIKDLRDRIATLTAEDEDMQKQIDSLAPNDASRLSMEKRVTENVSEIQSLTYEMDLATGNAH